MKYKVSFSDVFEADSEIDAYDELCAYLRECVEYEDVTAFDFAPYKKDLFDANERTRYIAKCAGVDYDDLITHQDANPAVTMYLDDFKVIENELRAAYIVGKAEKTAAHGSRSLIDSLEHWAKCFRDGTLDDSNAEEIAYFLEDHAHGLRTWEETIHGGV